MRHLLIASLVVLLGVSMSAADKINPAFFGTWKLNPAKSKADPGPMVRSQTVTIEPRGDGFTLTADTENADGTTSHTGTHRRVRREGSVGARHDQSQCEGNVRQHQRSLIEA